MESLLCFLPIGELLFSCPPLESGVGLGKVLREVFADFYLLFVFLLLSSYPMYLPLQPSLLSQFVKSTWTILFLHTPKFSVLTLFLLFLPVSCLSTSVSLLEGFCPKVCCGVWVENGTLSYLP